MIPVVVLDTGPLGLVTNPRRTSANVACRQWIRTLESAGVRILIPEIADYEVRRELLRANKRRGLLLLDQLIAQFEYVPLTTPAMRRAATLWAWARQQGVPTAHAKELDCDVLVAAQALTLNEPQVVVATTNVAHLIRYVPADLWENIK